MTQEELEAQVDKELEETIKRVAHEKKRQAKKEREREAKQDLRKKQSVIAAQTINDDEELTLDAKTWNKLREFDDLEEIQQYLPDEDDEQDEQMDDANERKFKFLTDGGQPDDESDSDSDADSVDSKQKAADRMAREAEEAERSRKEYKMLKSKKEAKKELKAKNLIEMQRQRKADLSEDEALDNTDIMKGTKPGADSSENDDDLEEEREMEKLMKEAREKIRARKTEEEEEEKALFKNPLLAFQTETKKKKKYTDESESEEWSDDDKYDPKEDKKAKKDKKSLLGKRKRNAEEDKDELKSFFGNKPIEEVPVNDMEKKDPNDLPSGYSSMDSDDIAETRALAKKMLRKKFRTETIDNSYSRYAYDDDGCDLPQWFLDDEAKHNVPNINLTKEEVDEEKRVLREWNARPSKKVTEAKARKKMRLAKAMNKIKNKAQVIANQEQSEGSKMR